MLTVCCARSLDQYQEYKIARDKEENQLAFPKNVSNVSSWLHNSETSQDENEDLGGVIALLVRKMIREDPTERFIALKAIEILRNTDKLGDVFCSNCI